MNVHKLFSLILVLTLLATLTGAASSAPLAGPCAPGATYDPACDANQDGVITVNDIQLTAGHWSQTGAYVSDNNHNHLGQTWTGSNNPLVISGPFDAWPYVPGQPIGAALVLQNTLPTQTNSYGYGLRILDGAIGAVIDHAGTGVWVQSADANGLIVNSAGTNGLYVANAVNNGVYVNSAINGLYVNSATGNGVHVNSASSNGVYVGSASQFGVRVDSAGYNGLLVTSAGYSGVVADTAQASGEWGFYTDDKIHGNNVLAQSFSLVAQVSGPDTLTPGDIVAVVGVANPPPGSTVHMPLVRLADATFTGVIGVVASRLVLTAHPSQSPTTETEMSGEPAAPELRSADGPAHAGDYVALTIFGAAQVKATSATPIVAGQRLTVAARPGYARSLRTVEVQGVLLAESAPVIGVAMETATDGLVWVMVNPQ